MTEERKFKTIAQARQDVVKALPRRHTDDETGLRIRDVRLSKGLTQRELAFPGCSYAYLSRIEAGTRFPTMQVLVKLAILLDVPSTYLAMGRGEPNPLTDEEREQLFDFLGLSGEPLKRLRDAATELNAAYERRREAVVLLGED